MRRHSLIWRRRQRGEKSRAGDRRGIRRDECQGDLSRNYLWVLSFVLRQINEGKPSFGMDVVVARLLLCCVMVEEVEEGGVSAFCRKHLRPLFAVSHKFTLLKGFSV